LNKIKRGEVAKVVIEYPEDLQGLDLNNLKFFMEGFGVELVVLKMAEETKKI